MSADDQRPTTPRHRADNPVDAPSPVNGTRSGNAPGHATDDGGAAEVAGDDAGAPEVAGDDAGAPEVAGDDAGAPEVAGDDAGVPGPGVAAPLFTAHLEEGLDAALRAFAAAPTILVGLDFDGVLAPIVLDPKMSRMLPTSAAAIADLVALAGVTVAVVSGREANDLVALADVPAGTKVVGSHGAQWGTVVAGPDGAGALEASPVELSADQAELRAELIRLTHEIADGVEGAWVQEKPAAAVLHTRQAARDDAARLTQAVLDGPATRAVQVIVGKEVVEMAVLEVTKGDALVRLRPETGADAVLYAGDDTTDEDAFAVLGEGDVSIKIGDGDSAAAYRVTDPEEFSAVLVRLVQLRQGTLDTFS
ncbi:trehalose-phosphatase [Georgenia yuyongxinii]|uniref:Trehalose 6-phosphate phosphatase n=1 Tax=Georgenia yuyongxinii TaxID=2589797 RepID=A0A5B8BZA4_9MICO|nr:trehalose-phosphatase [Georgenia yuyongxinii]QDC23608.1 trehalose-phosphatase [Georgenia yuyongxinii]